MSGLIIILLCICGTRETWAFAERQCSRYHYEEQILSKQIRMEIRLENLENTIKDIQQQQEKVLVKKSCEDEWIQFQSSCYLFGTITKDFEGAKAFCEISGAQLVSIKTAVENDFIKRHVAELSAPIFWIGLTDITNEDDWKWTGTDEKVQFLGWNNGEPNGGTGSNCASIWAKYSNNWVDEPCTNRQFMPICEK